MKEIKVVGVGALNIDHIYKVERILGDGETAADREYAGRTPIIHEEATFEKLGVFPGGSAANTIYGLAKLGISTGFCGVVGDDNEGKTLLRDFEGVGVDTSRIKIKPGAKTGSAKCYSDKLNFRSISVTPGANSLLVTNDIDSDYLNQAEMIHISSFVDDAQVEVLLELVTKLGSSIKISFSPGELFATQGLKVLNPILSRTYVLFANEKEIEQLTGKDFQAGAKVCLKQGCHIVVVTLGKGTGYKSVMATSYIRTNGNEYAVEPANKKIISSLDTIGAGDAFAAGFLYGMVNDKNLEECGRLGDITAKFCIGKTGARAGLPTLKELSQRYRQLYNQEL
jgi:ribokinase